MPPCTLSTSLEQQSLANFFCTAAGRKYFRLCEPSDLCHNYSTPLVSQESRQTAREQTGVAVFQLKMYTERFWPVCQNLLTPGLDQTKAPIQRDLHFLSPIKPSQDGRRICKIFVFLLRYLSS